MVSGNRVAHYCRVLLPHTVKLKNGIIFFKLCCNGHMAHAVRAKKCVQNL